MLTISLLVPIQVVQHVGLHAVIKMKQHLSSNPLHINECTLTKTYTHACRPYQRYAHPLSISLYHTHTCTHARTRTHTHTHTGTHTHTHTHTHAHTHNLQSSGKNNSHGLEHTHTLSIMCALTHTHACTRAHTDTLIYCPMGK